MQNFPPHIRSAIASALGNAQKNGGVFDAYAAAIGICEAFPDAHIQIDGLIDSMITHLGGIHAVEISPPGPVIEILFPVDDDDEILSSRLATEGASYAKLFEPHEIEYFARLAGEAARSAGVADETVRFTAAMRVLTLAAKGESDSQKLVEIARSCFRDGGSHGPQSKETS